MSRRCIPELETPIGLFEAMRSWVAQGPNGFRGVTIEDHWHVLNLWWHEDDHDRGPECTHPVLLDATCIGCGSVRHLG